MSNNKEQRNPKSEFDVDQSPAEEGVQLSREATVAYQYTEDGVVRNESPVRSSMVLTKFSTMKYGDRLAADYFADAMVQDVIRDEQFLAFIQQAEAAGKQVYITSPAIYNVPSASNILVKSVADRLNVFLSVKKLPTVVHANQTRLEPSHLNYAEQTVAERQKIVNRGKSILPEKFHQNFVIFVDDVFVSGAAASHAKHRLLNEVKADNAYFMFAMSVDPKVVAETDGSIEAQLNNYAVDGSLASLKPIFASEFTPVQKTLQVLFDEANHEQLFDFLMNEVADHSLVQLYLAAAGNDWRNRWSGKFAPGIEVLTDVLQQKKLIREDFSLLPHQRRLLNKNEYAAVQQPTKIALFHIAHRSNISAEVGQLYSRMKYSDPEATEKISQMLFEHIWADPKIQEVIQTDGELCISSSPYGEIPTAAANMVHKLIPMFEARGVKTHLIKIEMAGHFGTTNYGAMTVKQREECLNSFSMDINSDSAELMKDKFVLIVDDLNATGFHEKLVHRLFERSTAREHAFAYIVDFDEQLAHYEPETEEYINNYTVKSLNDLMIWYGKAEENGTSIKVNARTIKFILAEAGNKPTLFNEFLSMLSNESLSELYLAAFSSDGYATMPRFARGAQQLENFLLAKGLLNVEDVNQRKNRVIGFSVSVNENGDIVDMATGEVRNDLGLAYSLMKYGSRADIQSFADVISTTFIRQLDDETHPVAQRFAEAKQNGEHVVHIVPGSRNVESSSYFLHQLALENINVELALRGLPTIVSVKLPRLRSIPGEYASFTQEQRATLARESDHILPGKELYAFPMHVLFADDVRITGSTADAVECSALANGAKSFTEMYALLVDPQVAHLNPKIENWLNSRAITGALDDLVAYILNQEGFQPVQRLLRVLFNPENQATFYEFMFTQVVNSSLIELYKAALRNDYLADAMYEPAVRTLQKILQEKKIVDQNGRFIRSK